MHTNLARRQRQARVLAGAGQPAGPLPHPSARRRHGLRLVWRHHRPGERQERRLLRLSGRHEGCLRQQDARPSDARREGHPRSDPGADRGSRAHRLCPPPRRGGDRQAALRPPRHAEAERSRAAAEQRRLANFVDFIGEGRGSQALAKALVETERRVDALTDEVDGLRRSREKIFRPPPIEWIKDRLSNIQQVLEQRTARSAQTLRNLLGPIRLELVTPDIGRPFYRAVTTLDALALIEEPPPGWCGGRFEFFAKVETAGIEPASAVAQKVASTSVAGTLISPSTRLAGGVVGGQLRRCPRRGWSGPHRVSPLFEPDRHRGRMVAG